MPLDVLSYKAELLLTDARVSETFDARLTTWLECGGMKRWWGKERGRRSSTWLRVQALSGSNTHSAGGLSPEVTPTR